jgi:hypothetical protein
VTLVSDNDFSIATVRTCLTINALVPIASVNVAGGKRPDCDVNPALQKTDSLFVFAPAGCDPATTCSAMCAVITGPVFSPPIPDNSMLYSCRVAIPTTTALGRYPLACGGPNSAVNTQGQNVAVTCNDGEVFVQSLLPGDCNGDGMVSVDELVLGVNISLGLRPITDCLAFDTDFNGRVSIDELIKAVNAALNT